MKKDNQEVPTLQGLCTSDKVFSVITYVVVVVVIWHFSSRQTVFSETVSCARSNGMTVNLTKGKDLLSALSHKLRLLDYGSQNILLHFLIQSPPKNTSGISNIPDSSF